MDQLFRIKNLKNKLTAFDVLLALEKHTELKGLAVEIEKISASPCKPHIMRGRQSDYFIIATILGFYKKDIPKEVFDNLCNELIAALA